MASRYLIGIDLGTTNSAVAWVDTAARLRGGRPTIHRLAIPQVVRPGEIDTRDGLPSFLYFPLDDERAALASPVVGAYARDHGALVAGRLVSSAKSWLCHPDVDRTAPILPWGHEGDEVACSPVDASARYLAHLREAWNAGHGEADRFERQDLVLTVPASFDEEARELTVRAAREAGLDHVTLLEEPLAAFYAWIAAHAQSFRRTLRDGDEILICDVGGGTTDFTLVRAAIQQDEVRFERTAVGEHLLLGGDNLDLALAREVEAKLGDSRLALRQRQALARATSAAKERLLGDEAPDRTTVVVPAAGRAVVGRRLSAELTRDEVVDALRDGFLPRVSLDDVPARTTRAGLREFGLPYATEPAITRHLAAFLARAALARQASSPAPRPVRPDAVLFNGGFFTPAVAREAVVRTLEAWFGPDDPQWRLKVLANRHPASAVAIGGAYYAFVRDHGGLRVSAGTSRAYYVGLHGVPEDGGITAVCVMPRGTEEGTTLDLASRAFTIATNRPVSFPLYSATARHDRAGDVIDLDDGDRHEHAPLVTILRYGKKSRQADLPVHLSARFTEVGTLELWCHSNVSDHRWRLQFELRATEHAVDEEPDVEAGDLESGGTGAAALAEEASVVVADDTLERAVAVVREVFAPPRPAAVTSVTPETLVAGLESLFGFARIAWPLMVIRRLGDVLLECAAGRQIGPRHEARWLNLTGFCLRPGFGATLDEWRMDQLRRLYPVGLTFPNDVQAEAEWLVLWQRVAGGLSAGQQQEIYQRQRAGLGIATKKSTRRLNPQIEREGWRLLASLERLPAATRAALGDEAMARLGRQADNAAFLWSVARVGARIPAYGPMNTVVSAARVSPWIEALLVRPRLSPDAQSALVQMAARTDDPARDIGDLLRDRVTAAVQQAGAPAADLERLRRVVAPARADALRLFGESLPDGLRLAP